MDQTNSQKTSCQKQTSSSADRALLSPTSLNPNSGVSVTPSKQKLDANAPTNTALVTYVLL